MKPPFYVIDYKYSNQYIFYEEAKIILLISSNYSLKSMDVSRKTIEHT